MVMFFLVSLIIVFSILEIILGFSVEVGLLKSMILGFM